MKEKTAVQQIIEKFEHIQKNDCKTLPEVVFFDGVLAILESVYLGIEKKQIIEAHDAGIENPDSYGGGTYYKEKYN